MSDNAFRFEDFERLVAVHGTEPDLWPDPTLAAQPDIAVWLSAELAMEARLLDTGPASNGADLSANFADRVIAALPPTRNTSASGLAKLAFVGSGALAGAFAVALVLGDPNAPQTDFDTETDAETWAALADEAGFADLYEWAYAPTGEG